MDFQSDLEKYTLDEAEEVKDPAPNYTNADTVFALMSFVLGYLFINWMLFVPESLGLGATLLVVAFSVMSVIYLRLKGIKLTACAILGLIGIDGMSLAFLFSANGLIKFLVTVFIIFALAYWYYSSSGNREEGKIGDMLPFDLLKSVLVLPFVSFGKLFGVAKSGIKSSSAGKKIGMALLGILIAVIPTAIITALLLNADDAFANLADGLFKGTFEDLPKNIWFFILGIPVAMYVFGMMYSNAEHRGSEYLRRENNEKALGKAQIAPAIMTCFAITPIIIVYVLFFLSQTGYFLSAFSGIRPEGITYAEYARRGFFELCAVSVVNLVVIVAACLFTKREDGKRSRVVRGYVITLAVFTLMLIAIAVSKMVMYIDAYGLTRMRVYTTWFMIALAVLFVFIIVRQLTVRFNLFRNFTVVAVAMFAVLVFADVDAQVARYNVDCYRSGKLESVDIIMMYDLSDSAIKYVESLVDDENPRIANTAKQFVDTKRRELEDREYEFANFNLVTDGAKRILGVRKE